MNLLVTGGAGFIGSNFIRYWLEQYPADKVVNLDLLTYAGNLANLDDVVSRFADRYAFARGDIGNVDLVEHLLAEYKIDAVVNFAAETHNSRAVLDPASFFRTNVLGTQGLMEACRRQKVARIHHVSTCEVFGDLDLDSADSFSEEHPYRPRTPYNAAKAGSDFVVRSYHETFGLPVTISTCSNNFGPYQFPEKLIPLFTTNAIDDLPLPLYRSSVNRREWLYVSDHCRAIDLILNRGRIGELYNIGSGVEQSVEQITDRVLALLGKPSSLKTYVPDRPGHDRRYLLNSSKIRRELGWQPEVDFDEGMRLTVSWYATNEDWWRPLKERLAVQEGSWVGLYIHLLKENPIVADNSSKRRFAPEDIYRMRTAADPHIAPDGKLVAMVVTTTDRAANRFRANIWGVSLDGEPPRRLTAGQKADSHPRWSADGRLAFISDRGREHEAEEAGGGGKSQIWLLDMNGAEARQLTFIREGVSGFAWSPDGKRIAFIAEVEEPALVEAEDSIRKLGAKMLSFTAPIEAALAEEPAPPTDSSGVPGMEGGEERVVVQPVGEEPGLGEEEKVEANKSKVITRLHYKFDGAGIYETKRSHIFVIDVPPASQFDFEAIFSEQDAIGKPKPKDKDKKDEGADKNLNERLKKAKERDPRDRSRQLTFGDYDDAEPTWTHDGRLIFVSNRLEDRDRRTSMSDLFIVDTANLADGQQPEPRQITRSQGLATAPAISPDGRQLAYVGHNQGDDSSGVVSTHVWLRDLDTEAEFRDLTAGFDRSIGGEGATVDTPCLHWAADGSALYFLAGDRGNSSLFRLPLDGGAAANSGPERGTPLQRLVSSDRRLFAFDITPDGQQIASTAASTFHHSDLFACAADGSSERRLTNLMGSFLGEMDLGTVEKFSIENEGLPIDGWVLKPPDFDASKKYPLVLQIHGGPQGSFGDGWVIFNILLAARGYVVVYANCRGSSSYGEQFARGCFNDWGGGDYRDLIAALDYVIAQGYIDETRLGITGYSYGGYMTNWAVTQTNRFKAAVTQASLSNMHSDWGTCDTGTTFDNDQFGGPPFDDPSLYLERSAINHVRNVSTPLLILHSEADYRCTMEQAEQFYTALKWLGKEVAFVRFPNESHGLFRKGQPRHAVEWVSLMLGWFDKYL